MLDRDTGNTSGLPVNPLSSYLPLMVKILLLLKKDAASLKRRNENAQRHRQLSLSR
jgi:hypothetical protein